MHVAADPTVLQWMPTPQRRFEWLMAQLYGGHAHLPPTPYPQLGDLRLPDLIPWQREFLGEIIDPEGAEHVAVYGGIGCGKSITLAFALFLVAMSRPGSVSMIVSDSMANLQAISIADCVKVFGDAARFIAGVKSRFEFKNGSTVQVRSYQLPDTRDESHNPIEGRTITGILIVDEVQKLPMEVFTHANDRTRGESRDVVHSFYPKVVLNGRPGAIDWWPRLIGELGGRVFRPKTAENPHNGPRYLEKLKKGRTPAEYLCVTTGTPMPAKGACYGVIADEAWPRGNVLDGFEVDEALPVTIGYDFGRRHPAVIFVQSVKRTIPRGVVVLDADGNEIELPPGKVTLDVVFDELMPDDIGVPGVIRLINAKADAGRYRIAGAATDPAGGTENEQTRISNIKLLKRARNARPRDGLGGGIGCRVTWTHDAEKTSVESGILQVSGAICGADRVRLLVFARSFWERSKRAEVGRRTLYGDLLRYKWRHVHRKSRARVNPKDDPSHGPDALRYWFINYRWRQSVPLPSSHRPATAFEREQRRMLNSER